MEIKAIRERSGLSQKEAAERIGVPATTLCRWEKGNRSPLMKQIPAIARGLGCKIADLFGGDDEQAT